MNKYELKEILDHNVVTVVFEKVDGTTREMKCTLLTEYVPVSTVQLLQEGVPTAKPPRHEPDGSIAVWDIEANGWRSFRVDSIKEIHY